MITSVYEDPRHPRKPWTVKIKEGDYVAFVRFPDEKLARKFERECCDREYLASLIGVPVERLVP